MTYISSNGTIQGSQSWFRLSILTDTFWAIINFFVLFFHTMFSPNLTKKGNQYSSDYRSGGGGFFDSPPRPPQRRMGRIGGGGGGGFSPGALPPGGG
ncbi:selenoprotein K isoform X1 [Hydra vulgaris]|uniref:selenoprotein K isoform X1 n=1 Tax=Hydra vulgaris TaxID=6087 RepID=UPI0006416BBE|nr:selenoprotein K isoform X1 [Hydra vulgaris]